jgi:hypothetical protein
MSLTELQIKHTKPKAKPYRIADSSKSFSGTKIAFTRILDIGSIEKPRHN